MRPHLDYSVIAYYMINLKMTDLLAKINKWSPCLVMYVNI